MPRTELIHLSEVDILLETTDIVLSTMLIKRLVDENIPGHLFVMINACQLHTLMPTTVGTIPVCNSLVKSHGARRLKASLNDYYCTKISIELLSREAVVFLKRANQL